MNIEQMRSAMSAKYEVLKRMKDEIEGSGRKSTQSERDQATELLDEISDLHIAIKTEETGEFLHSSIRTPTRPDLGNSYPSGGGTPGKHFRSFGEQLQAIRTAGMTGEQIDSRLFQIRAATGLSESVPSDGGFLIEPTFSREIFRTAFTNAQIAPLCREIPIGGNSNSVKVNAFAETNRTSSRFGGLIGYWLAEAGTKVASAPKFRQMELALKKFVVLCYATDELLQDAALLDQTLRQGFAEELALRLDDGIIRGTGAGQPLGVLNSAALISVARNTAATISIQDVMNMWGRLLPGSHKNAVWIINPDSLPTLYQLTITVGTTGGQPVFLPGGTIQGVPYSTLLGRPVIVSEVGSSLATAGSLILADFTCYGIITKGTKVDTSMHLAFLTDQSIYRGVTRIDGMPLLSNSITPFKGANTLSAFISLAA